MKFALMYAMPAEIQSLIHDREPDAILAGIPFYHLSPSCVACCGGVGKVNAAMATQVLIGHYHPELVINVGVAGCLEDLPVGTTVLAEGFLQHDVDTTAVGDPIGLVSTVNQVLFPTTDLARAKAAMDKAGIPYRTGLVATGDWFATDGPRAQWIRDTFHPLLCEMEGGAIAQVCLRNQVPFMSLKSVSDCIFAGAHTYFDFPAAMEALNTTVTAFLNAL